VSLTWKDPEGGFTSVNRALNTCKIQLPVDSDWSDIQTQGLLVHEAIHAGFYLFEAKEGRGVGPPPPGFGGLNSRAGPALLPTASETDQEALAYLAQAFFLCSEEAKLEEALELRRSKSL
jgi:hypothetical protein